MKRKCKKLKQFLVLVLACLMVVTTIPTAGLTAYAAQSDIVVDEDETVVPDEQAEPEEVAAPSDIDEPGDEAIVTDEQEQPEDESEITDEEVIVDDAQTEAETDAAAEATATIKWSEEKPGTVVFSFQGVEGLTRYVLNLYHDEEQIYSISGDYNYDPDFMDDCTSDFRDKLNKSGLYTAKIYIGSKLLAQDTYEYIMPDKKLPAPTNIKWIKDKDGIPTEITWDAVEGADTYMLWLSSANSNGSWSMHWATTNSITIGEFALQSLGMDNIWYVKVRAMPKDIKEAVVSDYSEMVSVEVGDVSAVPVAPQEWGIDNAGQLKFISGDAPNGYYFLLKKGDSFVKDVNTVPCAKGESGTYPWGMSFHENGKYELLCYVLDANKSRILVGSKTIDYVCPPEQLEPVVGKLDGKILSWNTVEDALYYSVVMHFKVDGRQYSATFDQAEGVTSVDVSDMLTLGKGKTDVGFRIVAMPKNMHEKCWSRSELIPYTGEIDEYTLVGSIPVMIVDDPACGKITLKVMDNKDRAVTGVTYKSTDTSVLKVDAKGVVEAVGEGEAGIIATFMAGKYSKSLQVRITVKKYVTGIEFIDKEDERIFPGEEDSIKLAIVPADIETDFEVTSDNEILKVTASDTKASGSAIIKVAVDEKAAVTDETEAVVTAKVTTPAGNTFTATKKYIITPVSNVEIPEVYMYSLATMDKTLAGVSKNNESVMPDGWDWVEPNLDITKYDNVGEVKFAIVAEAPYTHKKVYGTATVKFGKVSAILLQPVAKLVKNEKTEISVQITETFKYDDWVTKRNISPRVKFTVDKPGILAVDETKTGLTITANDKGRANIFYWVEDEKTGVALSATNKHTIDVVLGEKAEVEYSIVDNEGTVIPLLGGCYEIVKKADTSYTIVSNTDDYAIAVTTTDATTVKVTNGAKLVKDGKADIKPMKAGYAVLNITAADAVKTTDKILIKVVDESADGIVLSKEIITFDTGKSYPRDEINLYDSMHRSMKQIRLLDAKGNDITGNYSISHGTSYIDFEVADESKITAGRVKLEVTMDDDVVKTFNVTIKKTATKPKVTVKQIVVGDAMIKDVESVIEVKSNDGMFGQIEVVDLAKDDYSVDIAKGWVTIHKKDAKVINLSIQVGGYKPINQRFTVKTVKTAYVPSKAAGTIYTDVANSYVAINILNRANRGVLSMEDCIQEVASDSKFYDVAIDETSNALVLTMKDGAKPTLTERIKVTYTRDDLAKPVEFVFTVKAASLANAKLVVATPTVTLYNYTQHQSSGVDTQVSLVGGAGCDELLNKIKVSEVVNARQGASLNKTLSVKCLNGKVVVQRVSNNLAAGTYTFNLTLDDSAFKRPISAKLIVKVITVDEKTPKSSVSVNVTAKNGIDVYDRLNTAISLKPRFTNATGLKAQLVDVQGRDAYLFYVDGVDIKLDPSAAVLEKETYLIKAVYEVAIADDDVIRVASQDIKVKFRVKKPAVAASAPYGNVFYAPGDVVCVELRTSVNDKDMIVTMQQSNPDFSLGAVAKGIGYTNVMLVYNPTGKTARNRTYTIKLEVKAYNDAPKDSKPVVVSVPVKIAK